MVKIKKYFVSLIFSPRERVIIYRALCAMKWRAFSIGNVIRFKYIDNLSNLFISSNDKKEDMLTD